MSNFNIGDSVEVLPCTEGGALHELAHCQVAGRRGTVLIMRDAGRVVGVHFPGLCGNNLFGKITTTTGWWCDPVWLRRVLAQEKVVHVTAGPRYKVGDLVDGDEFECGVVTGVETEPGYTVRWPSGYVQWIKESTLSPHRPAPVVCAPDGTRCAWMGAISGDADLFLTTANYCKMCGGKLKEGA